MAAIPDHHMMNNHRAAPPAHHTGAPQTAAANSNGAKERHVLAERYKTKMCRNFMQTGVCPYETRCMFAHGDHELRTTEMNVSDGLITDEAIKSFQRVLKNRQQAQQQAVAHSTRPPPQHTWESTDCACDECMQQYRYNPYAAGGASPYYYTPCDCADCAAPVADTPVPKEAPEAPEEP